MSEQSFDQSAAFLTAIMYSPKTPKILIAGAGPVGALVAIYAARRGYLVELYELRDGA